MKKYKDYYKILGVARDASHKTIKQAYRKRALIYHPDRNKASYAEARFKEINEAHEVLSDPKRRAAYDQRVRQEEEKRRAAEAQADQERREKEAKQREAEQAASPEQGSAPPDLVECPLCGKHNLKTDTFRCRQCGRDNLCLQHKDQHSSLCTFCEDELARKRQKAESGKAGRQPASAAGRKKSRVSVVMALLFLFLCLVGGGWWWTHSRSSDTPPKPEPVKPGSVRSFEIAEGVFMEFVEIPAGSFEMGCTSEREKCADDEKPRHKVRLSKPFYLGKYEVTQAQWEAVMGKESNRSCFKGADRPVENVSWYDIRDFLKKLNANVKKGGLVYRLPTEAEWEYAARAGSKTVYSFGDSEAQLRGFAGYNDHGGETHPVGKKKPNAWGLYDMHGNVWEWVQDWYGEKYYRSSFATDDPSGPSAGEYRVLRGGSWSDISGDADNIQVASRDWGRPDSRFVNSGFRLALSPRH